MDVPVRRRDGVSEGDGEESSSIVTSHQTRPGRTVFTERDNADGWIATDLAVELEP